jgi:hypothetical protein
LSTLFVLLITLDYFNNNIVINSILNIKVPKIRKEKQSSQFIGIVNYYRNMWFCKSELLACTHWLDSNQEWSSLNGTNPINRPLIKWRKSSIITITFILIFMNQIIRRVRHFGEKKEKTINYYSRKPNAAHKRYTIIEKRVVIIYWYLKVMQECPTAFYSMKEMG